MDEDISIINSNTRNEKIKNFFLDNKKKLILIISSFIIILVGYFSFKEYLKKQNIIISDKYYSIIINHTETNKDKTITDLIRLVENKNTTYSPLALFYIIDNNLISEVTKINELFDIVIQDLSLDKEIKNLIIYKKALYNADHKSENELLEILNPIINSKSVWKSHSLYLMGEYFFSKNQKEKSKEFYNEIIILENANKNLKVEAQKRLNRDLSE